MIIPFENAYSCDSITLNVTNNCNLSCTYCFEHNKNVQNMPSQIAIDTIDKAYRHISTAYSDKFTINLFGGEPLLNWQCIKDLIDHCNKKNYDISYGITTNLTGLTDEMIEYFDDVNMFMLVSCDGIREVHNKNRNNSWDRVIANLKRIKEAGLLLYVELRMTILPEDVKYALQGVKYFVDFGIDNICPMVVTDVEWSDEHIKELEQFYYQLNEYYVECLNKDWNRNIAIKNADDALQNVMSPIVTDPHMCPIFSRHWCCVDYKGDVYPCHQLPTSAEEIRDDQRMGNIYTGVDDDKFIEDDNKKKAIYPKEECVGCIAKPICKCGCIEENIRVNGNTDIASDGFCKTQRALVTAIKQFQDRLIYATNIRNRSINILIENLKIKRYIDQCLKDVDMYAGNKLMVTTRLMHIQELIASLGENKILPTFDEYFNETIINLAAIVLSKNDITVDQIKRTVEKGGYLNG